MIVTDSFVYLHMPKTAGTWVQTHLGKVLPAHYPSSESHVWLRDHQEHLEGRTVFASMRNPWDWYISWYQFVRASKRWRNQFLSTFGDPDDLDAALYGMTHPKAGIDPKVHAVPFDMAEWLQSGAGLYSHFFWAILAVDGKLQADILIDIGHVRQGVFEVTGVDLRDETRFPMVNTKEGRPHTILDPAQVWTPERIQWVREADGALADRLGYSGPGMPPREPLLRLTAPA